MNREPRVGQSRRAGMDRLAATYAAVAVLLAACTGALPGGASPSSPVLDGRTFLSTSVTQGSVARPLVPGSRIRISFSSGGLSAAAGCNQMGGAYRIEGGRLIADSLASTQMACDPPLMEQDTWLAGLLTGKPVVTLAGDNLTLDHDETVLVLRDRRVADPARPMVGPTWRVESLVGGQTVSSAPADPPATLTFRTDGRVRIETGCNTGEGSFIADARSLHITDIGLTKRACVGPQGQLEAAVLDVLRSGRLIVSIDAASLMLAAGERGLGLRTD